MLGFQVTLFKTALSVFKMSLKISLWGFEIFEFRTMEFRACSTVSLATQASPTSARIEGCRGTSIIRSNPPVEGRVAVLTGCLS